MMMMMMMMDRGDEMCGGVFPSLAPVVLCVCPGLHTRCAYLII